VPASPRAASFARAVVDGEMASSALHSRIDDAKTLITEVVTNAVKYGTDGQGAIRVVIDSSDDRLHVRVEQPLSAGSVRSKEPQPTPQFGGFGLLIVEALADSWGVESGPPGCVWFRIGA
jgi:anti-sigma regulatory factor (Ser/Thr protein kinase)